MRRLVLTGRASVVRRDELAHGLVRLVEGVRGKLARQHEARGGLNVAHVEGALVVHLADALGLRGQTLHQVANHIVEDVHGLTGDGAGRVDLAQNLEERVFEIDLLAPRLTTARMERQLPARRWTRGRAGAGRGLERRARRAGDARALVRDGFRRRRRLCWEKQSLRIE